jgi:hypothetical protein
MMTTQEIIDTFKTDDGIRWGIDTAMHSLRPGCLYSLIPTNNGFVITDWPENQWSDVTQSYLEAPTSQEIRDEYIRHKTIAECFKYFKDSTEIK